MPTAIHRQVEAARRGELERVIARMLSGWAVLGDPQITSGYCLLLPDPVVSDLNALVGDARQQFLDDMAAVGDAVLEATGADRINYEILGNVEPALARPRDSSTRERGSGTAQESPCGCTTGRRPRPSIRTRWRWRGASQPCSSTLSARAMTTEHYMRHRRCYFSWSVAVCAALTVPASTCRRAGFPASSRTTTRHQVRIAGRAAHRRSSLARRAEDGRAACASTASSTRHRGRPRR
jgi:hypothetical protein